MKALIRNEGETVTENMGIAGINWQTGAPLTDAAWYGGPYVLVQNYVAPKSEGEDATYEIVEPEPVQEPEVEETEDPDIIMIDGKQYSKEELRALIGE